MQMRRHKIGISIGSANNNGPELILKALTDRDLLSRCKPLLIGPDAIFQAVNNDRSLIFDFIITRTLEFSWPESDNIIILDKSKRIPLDIENNRASKSAGEMGISSLDVGLNLAFQFKIDALVVGPICFESLSLAGFHYQSLSQIISEWTRLDKVEKEKRGQVVHFKKTPVTITAPIDYKTSEINKNPIKDAIEWAVELAEERYEY